MQIAKKINQYKFLFSQLVKRDFQKKYKHTVLGMLWSLLAPLLNLAVMALVFTQFFGRGTEHYVIYLFCGNIVFSYFNAATNGGMTSLVSNAGIFSKLNVPKALFLLSNNIAALINFGLTLIVLFIFVAIDGLPFTWLFFLLIYAILFLMIFNIGVGLILSALYVFFRDLSYLYGIFTQLVMYMSAIFYNVQSYSEKMQMMFYCNPVYCYITYFRTVIIDGEIPSLMLHILCFAYAVVFLLIGVIIYKKNNYKFLYYI